MKVTSRKIRKSDWDKLSEKICDTHSSRKEKRREREKDWKDIDRQISMTPDNSFKMLSTGEPDPNKAWLPEMELPLQAQTLELLTADARRMMFPDSGSWFAAHAELTDEYLKKVDFKSLVSGDLNDVPSLITQDNADKLVQGVSAFWQRQYDFYQNIDKINAEAFKYGMGVGRGRMVTKSIYQHSAKGVSKKKTRIPVLFPRSIKNTYPDDSQHHLMNEGLVIGPSVIFEKTQYLADLVIASKGSTDPNAENGGWMPKHVSRLKSNKYDEIQLLEYEGDIVIPRSSTDSIYVPNAIVTVASGEGTREIVRIRYNKYPFNSNVFFPYHCEHLDSAYPTSPLMKGRPLQIAAVNELNMMIAAGQLSVLPPIQYDRDDPELADAGGPKVFPGALWGTVGKVEPKQIGNPDGLLRTYMGILQQYATVTETLPSRFGTQTLSHTTAYSKDAEISRGTLRTVDYVKTSLKGAMEQWLFMEYEMGRGELEKESIYIAPYNGFVEISRDHLPDRVVFEAHGSGGPAEENAKSQKRFGALQLALQVDAQAKQMGLQTKLDLQKVEEQILREGGWTDIDALFNEPENIQPDQGQLTGLLSGEPSALEQ